MIGGRMLTQKPAGLRRGDGRIPYDRCIDIRQGGLNVSMNTAQQIGRGTDSNHTRQTASSVALGLPDRYIYLMRACAWK